MGIESTVTITRDTAIQHILQIDQLILDRNYRELESITHEYDCDIRSLVDSTTPTGADEDALNYWTETMLGDQMDRPLYRLSPHENYDVVEGDI